MLLLIVHHLFQEVQLGLLVLDLSDQLVPLIYKALVTCGDLGRVQLPLFILLDYGLLQLECLLELHDLRLQCLLLPTMIAAKILELH